MSNLPEGWHSTKLENCTEILDSQRIPVNSEERQYRIKNKSELFPYYGATGQVGTIDGYIFDEELIALGEDGVPFFDNQKNKAYMLYGKTWVNNHAHVLKADNKLTMNKFIFYFLNQFDYLGYVNGGTRLKLTQANMKRIPVILPPLTEQEEIVKRLDILLKHVEAIKSRIDGIPKILKEFRQSVLYAAVSGKLTEDWRGGETNFIKSCLKDLGQMTGGKTPNKSNKLFWQNGNIPWVSPKDMKFLEITSSQDLITDLAVTEASMQLLPEKTILMVTRSGILAHTFPVAITKIKVSINQDIKAFIPDANKVSAEFISIILRGLSYDILNSCAKSGTTVPSIETNALLKYKLNIPPLEEQTEIVRRVEEYFKLADSIEAKIKAAQVHINFLTQSILYQAFKGNLTKDWRAENHALISGENSAERLLERIKAEKGRRT